MAPELPEAIQELQEAVAGEVRRDESLAPYTTLGVGGPAEVLLLAHGASLVNPEDGQFLIDHTDAQGIQVGSSIERIAIEAPLKERTAAFKQLRFKGGSG